MRIKFVGREQELTVLDLTAIANGARTPQAITAQAGLPNVQVPKY